MKKIKERIIAIICVVCMACTLCSDVIPALASGDTPITLENAPEAKFDSWTFSDVGIDNQTITSDSLNWTSPTADAKSMNNTIFHGEILFPAGEGADFGNLYIGGSATETSKYNGFLIVGHTNASISLKFQNNGSSTTTQIKNFYSSTAGVNLRGNEKLHFSLSVQVLSEQDGIATVKLGVFFNGKLYNNEYYTVSDIPTSVLTQHVRMRYAANNPKIASIITLDNAPEKDFDAWTFSDVGIDNQTIESELNWTTPAADVASLDETIFHGKILFPTGTGNDIGKFVIGGSTNASDSKHIGFIIRGASSEAISLAFENAGAIINIANLYSSTAETTLRGNENLQMSLSVEFTSETQVKLGVFFNGKLYNNQYFTVDNLPMNYMVKHVKWKYGANSPKIASVITEDITLDNAPEKDFTPWTFGDMGIDDSNSISRINWESDSSLVYPALSSSLDETIFHGKIHFDSASSSIGYLFIGVTDASKWNGFRIYAEGTDKLKIDYQVGGTNTVYTLGTFDSTTARVALRENSDLLFSLSVEYTDVTEGQVDMKVGIFFGEKLYNNQYFTLENIPESNLNQGIRWHMGAAASGTQNGIASYPPATPKEDVTLETAPEKDFDAWTFRDVEIDDQTVKTDLNWGSDWEHKTASDSLHQTLFQGKINFANGEGDAADFYIGGADATDDETATTSKYGGFLFQTVGTTGLKLGYRVSGTNTIQPIAEFDSTTAETQLRGNADLWLAFSVEYLSVENGNATVKLGVFFDGNLYDDTYLTIENIPTKYLNQNIRLKAVQKNNVVASYPEYVPGPVEDIYLKDVPEKDFACWTFEDLGIDDQYLSVHLNWGDDFKKQSISNSLDKTIFNGLIHFPADTDNFGNFYLGGASANDDSKWRGFVFIANGTTDKLAFGFQGTEGMFFGKYGNTGSGAMSGLLATFDPEVAGAQLRGNSNLQLSVSVEYTAVTETTADLKVGVFFNEKLYNGEFLTLKDVPLEYLNQNVRYYAIGPNNAIASEHLCNKANGGDFGAENSKYEELTLRDFSVLNASVDTIEEGKDFRVENYCDWETLDGSAVSVVCNFPKNGSARFSVGGSFWRGVYVGSRDDGKLEVCYVNKAGDLKRLTFLDAATAGVTSLTGNDITIRLTFDVVETSSTTSDFRLGVYVNGTLYDGKHYTVRNADTETLTRTFKIYATGTPFTVKSVNRQPDLSIYGFDNKTWKSKI